ncbi:MAG: hypothetical protein H7293_03715, partial [Candidatus Saccharibacteria bacterium]|nr:hypothetical protein [Rhodoferax sp.]
MNAFAATCPSDLHRLFTRVMVTLGVVAATCFTAAGVQAAVVPQIAANSFTSMALYENGKLSGWGDNGNGL